MPRRTSTSAYLVSGGPRRAIYDVGAARPYQRLSAAVIASAISSARRGDAEAREWLTSPELVPWAGVLRVDVGHLRRLAQRALEEP